MNRQSLAAITAFTTSLTAFSTGAYAQVQDIGSPESGTFYSSAISADGSIVSGVATHPIHGNRVAVWSEEDGMRLFDQAAAGGSYAFGMSDNGRVIVGAKDNPAIPVFGSLAAVWNAATGRRVDIPLLPGHTNSTAPFVSGDGLTVVGSSSGIMQSTFRWDRITGTQEIPSPVNGPSRPRAVNRDGTVIVGSYDVAIGETRAFVWTPATGSQPIPGLGDYISYASGVSADGQVIVGRTGNPGFTSSIFYYRVGSAAVEVTVGTTTPAGYPIRVSGDGGTVIGTANFVSGQTGFAWNPGLGHVVLDASQGTQPASVSEDGSVICGTAGPLGGGLGLRAFRWDAAGLTILDAISPTEFVSAVVVSADGSTIAGQSRSASGEIHGAIWRSSGALGAEACAPAVANSTGVPGRLLLGGTNVIARGDLVLRAVDLPPKATTLFFVSRTTVTPAPFLSSQGLFCLGGTSGQFTGSGQIRNSGAGGVAELTVDLSAFPFPVSIIRPGDTLAFQAWHRDANPGATSNLTSAGTVQVF